MPELILRWLGDSWDLWIALVPYLALGFVLAGLLHGFMGSELVRRHLSRNTFGSILKATLIGIPLPVCSCGVIPLAESLRKDGASKGATLAFLVSTPTSGVDSILGTYGLMGPFFAVMRPLAGLLAGLGVGALTLGVDGPVGIDQKELVEKKATPWRWPDRAAWVDMLRYALQQLPRDTGKWLIIGTLLGGMVTALVPPGFIEQHLDSPFLQYLSVLLISVPLYVCATGSIPMAMGLMASGIMPGAALAFLIAGPATNTVTLTFIIKSMGAKVALVYLSSIVTVSVLLGLLTDAFFSAKPEALVAHFHHIHPQTVPLWVLVLAVAMLVWILWQQPVVSRLIRQAQKRKPVPLTTCSVQVPDMTCMVCERKILSHLSQLPGLDEVEVDLAAKRVVFAHAEQREIVSDELKKLGYHPERNVAAEG